VLFTHVFLLSHGLDFSLTFREMYSLAVTIAQAGEQGHKAEETKKLCRSIIEKYVISASH